MGVTLIPQLGRFVAGTAAAVTVLGLALGTAPAAAEPAAERTPITSYGFDSEPGDHIGGGQSRRYVAPQSRISLGGSAAEVTMSVDSPDGNEWWTIQIAAPRGETLHPGKYHDAERASFRTGRAPGLDVSGTGRGCNEVWGEFSIDQIETDTTGAVTVLEASFVQHCEGPNAPALRGTARYQAFPLATTFASDPGDFIGGGITKSYTGSTTIFGISGTTEYLSLSISGLRDHWTIELAPPVGEQLAVGTYTDAQRAPFREPGHPGIDISGNGRGCNTLTGSFTITALVADPDGRIQAIAGDVEQHCEGATPALRVKINYYAG